MRGRNSYYCAFGFRPAASPNRTGGFHSTRSWMSLGVTFEDVVEWDGEGNPRINGTMTLGGVRGNAG